MKIQLNARSLYYMVMWAFSVQKNKILFLTGKIKNPLDSEEKKYSLFVNFQFILINMSYFWEYSRGFEKLCVWQNIDKEEYFAFS